MIEKSLALAKKHVEEKQNEDALEALLSAWREKRHARIADVIDRVSARIARDPIEAKSVKERTALWTKIAKKKDHADIGRILATPWPGRWQDGLPVLTQLLEYKLDPRISMALVKLVETTPYDTWTSHRFYGPLFGRVSKTQDTRVLPIMKADVDRERSYYWKGRTKVAMNTAIAALEKLPAVELAPEEEKTLSEIEALFSGDVASMQAKAVGEKEMLAAIYAEPDDDARRLVFADFLSEREDPRGEFITLQMARHQGRSNEEMQRRENALLKKHGKQWAGACDRYLDRENRIFERGFLASGVLEFEGYPREPAKELADPAWSTVHTIQCTYVVNSTEGFAKKLFSFPSWQWLRAIRGLDEPTVLVLANMGKNERIEEIEYARDDDMTASDRKLLFETTSFPNLKRLTVAADAKEFEEILASPIGLELERVTILHRIDQLAKLVKLVEESNHPAREVCALENDRRRGQWHFLLTRDAKGKFTKLRGEPDAKTTTLPNASDLEVLLSKLPKLTELSIDTTVRCEFEAHEIRSLEERIGSMKSLEKIDVPWERLGKQTSSGIPLRFDFWGEDQGLAHAAKWWKLVHEPPLSLTFDSYSLNAKGHTALPGDALDHVVELSKRKRTDSIRLYRKGDPDTCAIELASNSIEVIAPFDATKIDACIEWVVKVLDTLKLRDAHSSFFRVKDGEVEYNEDMPSIDPHNETLRWITSVSPDQIEMLPAKELAKVRFPGMRVIPTKRNVLMIFGERPDKTPPKEKDLVELEIALWGVLWNTYKKDRGFIPHELARKTLGKVITKHGFEEEKLDPLEIARGHVRWSMKHPNGKRAIHISVNSPMWDYSYLNIQVLEARGKPNADLTDWRVYRAETTRSFDVESIYVKTEKQITTGLEKLRKAFESKIVPWFEEAEEKPAKKKRR